MKVDLKKINFKEIFRSGRGKHARKENTGNSEFMADGFAEADGFGAMVHSSTPILRLKDGGKQSVWKQDLLLNCSCAALMTTAFALFCMSIDTPLLILFALPCFVMYMAVATLGSIKPGPVRWIAAAVIFVILAAVAAVWHSTVLGGVSMLINQFYDVPRKLRPIFMTDFREARRSLKLPAI